jgi:hypothetical protein
MGSFKRRLQKLNQHTIGILWMHKDDQGSVRTDPRGLPKTVAPRSAMVAAAT